MDIAIDIDIENQGSFYTSCVSLLMDVAVFVGISPHIDFDRPQQRTSNACRVKRSDDDKHNVTNGISVADHLLYGHTTRTCKKAS